MGARGRRKPGQLVELVVEELLELVGGVVVELVGEQDEQRT